MRPVTKPPSGAYPPDDLDHAQLLLMWHHGQFRLVSESSAADQGVTFLKMLYPHIAVLLLNEFKNHLHRAVQRVISPGHRMSWKLSELPGARVKLWLAGQATQLGKDSVEKSARTSSNYANGGEHNTPTLHTKLYRGRFHLLGRAWTRLFLYQQQQKHYIWSIHRPSTPTTPPHPSLCPYPMLLFRTVGKWALISSGVGWIIITCSVMLFLMLVTSYFRQEYINFRLWAPEKEMLSNGSILIRTHVI